MASADTSSSRNQLLSALSPDDLALIEPHLTALPLPLRHRMEDPHKPIKHVYFLDQGIASVVAVGTNDKLIEVGIIGREGMTGITVVMGDDRSPHQTYIQMDGAGHRIERVRLRGAMEKSASMRQTFLKFAQAFMIQTAHTAIANGRATVEERLARWLLMAHDRGDGDQLTLTHEFLALMLGVRRAGVTVALGALSNKGMISTKRGTIQIRDRKALLKVAAGYYGGPEAELKRLLSA